mgnify:CR=1 FL=1
MDFEKIRELLSLQLNLKPELIKRESRIVDDLGADSLDVVELLMTLEDEFGVTVSDEEAVKIKTVDDIINIVGKDKKEDKKEDK